MNNLHSLSLFVGTGQCNAYCAHCGGIPLRKYAPKKDDIVNQDLVYKTIKQCYELGARRLSITSSGEPTLSPLSVTKILELVHDCRKEGIEYSPIRIYSNAIRLGEDKNFCDTYLALWKNYGLTTFYVTIFDADEQKNAGTYGRSTYPELKEIASRLHDADLLMRGNLVVSKNTISTLEKFVSIVAHLKKIGVDYISAWPIRGNDDKVDLSLLPPEQELDRIDAWIEANKKSGYKIDLLREHKRAAHRAGKKLTLFPDGILSDTWCND